MRHLTGLLVFTTLVVAFANGKPQAQPYENELYAGVRLPIYPTYPELLGKGPIPNIDDGWNLDPRFGPMPEIIIPLPKQSVPDVQAEYAKVEKQREVLEETFATIEDARKALDQTYAPKAVILYNDHLLAVGPKEFLKLFWMGAENSRLISVDHKLNFDGVNIVETVKLYRLKDGKSTAWIGERFWNKIDGVYKITYANYKEGKELLKEI